ncbi:MAG TPA: esterase-like activity of phytase family protein [Chroococcidiopsis sp.]
MSALFHLRQWRLKLWAVVRSIVQPIVRPMVLLTVLWLLSGCALPQVSAEERLFLDVSLDFLGSVVVPADTAVEGMPVRGLSAIAYSPERDRLYALSDDRSVHAPSRFYTLKLAIANAETVTLEGVEVESVTPLLAEDGNPYPEGRIDPEGLALSPRQSVFVSTEGDAERGIAPGVAEFDLASGRWQGQLPIPERFTPRVVDGQPQGVQNNRGFEALTLNPAGVAANSIEPFRLFTATESSLQQDRPPAPATNASEVDTEGDPSGNASAADAPAPARFLHYLIGEDQPTLLAEHLYWVEPPPSGATENGLVDMVTLDQAGHFLALERSFGIAAGAGARIFQLETGSATDISGIPSLAGDTAGIQPIRKQLVLDLGQLGIWLDNLEGMAIGPRLPDGSQSLVLVSDDNFSDLQMTQFLLFRLRLGR